MKLAFISPPGVNVLPPYQKSAGIWTYEVARRLAQDHQVHVYTSKDPLQKEIDQSDGVYYHFISMGADRPLLSLLRRLEGLRGPTDPIFSTPLYNLGYAIKVGMDLRRRGIEFAHVNSEFQIPLVLRALSPATCLALHMRCEWLTQFDESTVRPLIRDLPLLLGCSEYVTKSIKHGFPDLAGRCHTVYPGVDVESFSPAPAECGDRVLFVGRISPEKGIHVLLDALEKVLSERPGASLELIGSQVSAPPGVIVSPSSDHAVRKLSRFYGPTRDHYYKLLLERIERSGVRDSVSFTNFLPHQEMPRAYWRSNVLVNPSIYESFGRSLIEAMACGRPVVATRVGGMPEIVEDLSTGLLVERNDPDSLATAIIEILERPGRATSMGSAGRQRVARLFSWERIVESLLEVYYGTRSDR